MTAPTTQQVERALEAVVAEMRAAGVWRDQPLPAEAYRFRAAFAADTMCFTQWLQFVFVPRVQELVAQGGGFPASSSVAVRAVREFDGQGLSALEARLRDFDALFRG